jgi:hypothetical protein
MKLSITISILVFLASCQSYNETKAIITPAEEDLNPIGINNLEINTEIEVWTKNQRIKTINEVNALDYDSISTDSTEIYIDQFFYFKGERVKAIGITKDRSDTVAFYYQSPSTEYMANGETCPIKNIELVKKGALHTYRGLKYKDQHIGIATYLQCDRLTFEKGVYFNGKKIGLWKTLDIQTNEITETDFGNSQLLNELLLLTRGLQ